MDGPLADEHQDETGDDEARDDAGTHADGTGDDQDEGVEGEGAAAGDPTDDDVDGDEDLDAADVTLGFLIIGLVAVAALAVLGLVLLWPRGPAPDLGFAATSTAHYVDATVHEVVPEAECPGVEAGAGIPCRLYVAELTSGGDAGEVVTFSTMLGYPGMPELSRSDRVVLQEFPDTAPEFRYQFVDYQRTYPLLALGAVFALVVMVFGGWQGARALAGLGLSLVILTVFIVPALLRDSPALPVALVGATVLAFLAIYLAHGFGLTSSIALAGTLVSLSVTTLLAMLVASVTQLSGLATEEAQVLDYTLDALDMRGLLVAGIVIGALGILDDVTVTQVSTVAALRRANPGLGPARLYGEAIRVGRDHVAAAVNTLVLAYAGAALPLLMVFGNVNQPLSRLLTGELVAVEIVRMLVGSVGLVLAVPITTGLAVVVLTRVLPADLPPDDDWDDRWDDDGGGYDGAVGEPPEPEGFGEADAATGERQSEQTVTST